MRNQDQTLVKLIVFNLLEIQHGGTVGHKVQNLPEIIIGEDNTEEQIGGEGQGIHYLMISTYIIVT